MKTTGLPDGPPVAVGLYLSPTTAGLAVEVNVMF